MHSLNDQDPFVHVFARDGCWLAYDVNSNQLLTVEPVLAALLRGKGDDEFSREEMAEAREAVKTGQAEDGLFLPRTVELVPPGPVEPDHDQGLRQLVLSVTERCNLRCGYCLHTVGREGCRPHGTRDMSRETAVEATEFFLDRAHRSHAPVISFYGGEPLLVPEVLESVVEAVARHPRGPEVILAVDTNGTLLDGRVVDLVLREKFHLQVSLDGPREFHDRWRRDRNEVPTFSAIMDNLDHLLSRDPQVAPRLSFVVTLTPEVDLQAVSDFFAAFPPFVKYGVSGAPRLRVNVADLGDQSSPEELGVWWDLRRQLRQARAAFLEAVAAEKRHEVGPVYHALFEPGIIKLYHRSRSSLGRYFTPGGNCQPGRRKLHVTVSGEYQPCEKMGRAGVIGQLSAGLDPGAITDLKQDFHDSMVDACRSCWAIRLCGVCYAVHHAVHHAMPPGGAKAQERACQKIQSRLEEDLANLAQILMMPDSARNWLEETVVD